ncbi:Galactomannan galactosyltransferase 1 [Camellia lanceoleosa]|uniref:Galactomannan galactosyltransferase 1 n=1 Tax=Camellia lanceoleosa TaxID=1840588 RepID=A0ACC0J3D9_9ERIC|nr:Galactomannan galactosyltransferase 1 [Camellia lanceoleosa]
MIVMEVTATDDDRDEGDGSVRMAERLGTVVVDVVVAAVAAKHRARTKAASFLSDCLLFVGGALVALLTVWALSSFINPNPSSGFSVNKTKASISSKKQGCDRGAHGINLRNDLHDPTFYDNLELSYSIEGQEIESWDEKQWD